MGRQAVTLQSAAGGAGQAERESRPRLAGRVPDLQRDLLRADGELFDQEARSNGRRGVPWARAACTSQPWAEEVQLATGERTI